MQEDYSPRELQDTFFYYCEGPNEDEHKKRFGMEYVQELYDLIEKFPFEFERNPLVIKLGLGIKDATFDDTLSDIVAHQDLPHVQGLGQYDPRFEELYIKVGLSLEQISRMDESWFGKVIRAMSAHPYLSAAEKEPLYAKLREETNSREDPDFRTQVEALAQWETIAHSLGRRYLFPWNQFTRSCGVYAMLEMGERKFREIYDQVKELELEVIDLDFRSEIADLITQRDTLTWEDHVNKTKENIEELQAHGIDINYIRRRNNGPKYSSQTFNEAAEVYLAKPSESRRTTLINAFSDRKVEEWIALMRKISDLAPGFELSYITLSDIIGEEYMNQVPSPSLSPLVLAYQQLVESKEINDENFGLFKQGCKQTIEAGTVGEWAEHISEQIKASTVGGSNYREVSA